MSKEKIRKVYVVGHKNPDTDSVCSAIAYAALKTKLTNMPYEARRAGQLNEETQYVLERFGVKPPRLLSDLREQIKDLELKEVDGIKSSVSIRTAWEKMQESNIHTLPVTRNGKLEGVITIGDIAKTYMEIYDSTILSKARTQYRNIARAVDGEVLTGNEHSYLLKGKVVIAASSRILMSDFISRDDLVIMGDRKDAQTCALEMNASCMVVCQNAAVSDEVIKKAQERQIVIIRTPHDTFTAAQHINQSIPVKYFMTRENLVTFKMQDYVDDVKEVMAQKRFRDFPVVDNKGRFLGLTSRRRLLNVRKKQVILVDHNEKSQAVDGVEEADVLEIIDHHRLGSIETMAPVFFRNQPVGCTATIVYQMYQEADIIVDPVTAGLLCSAIISDTLMFRSPTCTPLDENSARKLAELAGVDVETLAQEMFNAGSNLKGKTAEEICFLDFKQFNVNDTVFGVGQVNSLSADELKEIRGVVRPYLERARKSHGLDMIFFMLTNILTESSELLCCGPEALDIIRSAYDIPEEAETVMLKGVVSRKKQLVPTLVGALQQ
ncbi:MAG TPA: putative manganese-dependent inorganic diphosphatase [Candidatus Mediterraneibacter merdipullorum]|nr:putative manganese-dependent inorganic diphosphatase [Candidatus Mediterraneibacter merdipullorum]